MPESDARSVARSVCETLLGRFQSVDRCAEILRSALSVGNHAAVESGLKQYAGKRALCVRPLATDEGCFVKVTHTEKLTLLALVYDILQFGGMYRKARL